MSQRKLQLLISTFAYNQFLILSESENYYHAVSRMQNGWIIQRGIVQNCWFLGVLEGTSWIFSILNLVLQIQMILHLYFSILRFSYCRSFLLYKYFSNHWRQKPNSHDYNEQSLRLSALLPPATSGAFAYVLSKLGTFKIY